LETSICRNEYTQWSCTSLGKSILFCATLQALAVYPKGIQVHSIFSPVNTNIFTALAVITPFPSSL
jgi:hypothetical protein